MVVTEGAVTIDLVDGRTVSVPLSVLENACRRQTIGRRFTFDGEILAGTFRSLTALRFIKEWSRAYHVKLEAKLEQKAMQANLSRIAWLD